MLKYLAQFPVIALCIASTITMHNHFRHGSKKLMVKISSNILLTTSKNKTFANDAHQEVPVCFIFRNHTSQTVVDCVSMAVQNRQPTENQQFIGVTIHLVRGKVLHSRHICLSFSCEKT